MPWMGSKANIAAIVALNVADLQDGIVYFASTEKAWLVLEKTNTTATANDKSCFTAIGGGRWFLSRDSKVVATTIPTGAAAIGTRWVYQENGAVNSYDSVISYIYNGTTWIELDARVRISTGTPASLSKTPNSNRESWLNTTTGVVSNALNGSWVIPSSPAPTPTPTPTPTPAPTPAPGTIGINQTVNGYLDYVLDGDEEVVQNWMDFGLTGTITNQSITITLSSTAFEPYIRMYATHGLFTAGGAALPNSASDEDQVGIVQFTFTPLTVNIGDVFRIEVTSYNNDNNPSDKDTGNFVLSTVSP